MALRKKTNTFLTLNPHAIKPKQSPNYTTQVQGGAKPTDTFQMVIDNIWKQEKISETVYIYVQVCYLLPTNYKLIF